MTTPTGTRLTQQCENAERGLAAFGAAVARVRWQRLQQQENASDD